MSHIANKIDAEDKKLNELFSERRYKIDTFQREYRWRRQHVEAMISDLSMSFLRDYDPSATLSDVRHYDCYYMGPVVLCDDGVSLSVIDGQQRLTTLSLLFIYMSHLQQKLEVEEDFVHDMDKYLIVKMAGVKTFVLDVAKRSAVMKHLMETGNTLSYIYEEIDYKDESIHNILDRYEDIENLFPEQLKTKNSLSCFIEWLLYRVVMVQITAYSMDNAYTIFETMNDRGLSLNPTEILKAHILSKIEDESLSEEMNDFWKKRIAELKYTAGYDGDMTFFRAWFRAKYAETSRTKTVGSENEDFEQIGTQFHTWFKNNHKKMGIKTSKEYYFFVKSDLDFFSSVFMRIVDFKNRNDVDHELFHIMNAYPMADSLYYPLLMSSVSKDDGEFEVESKLKLINGFIDSYINIRTICHKTITQSSIRNNIYDMIRDLRGCSIDGLCEKLLVRYDSLEELLNDKSDFLSFFSSSYMHYLLAREKYRGDESITDFEFLLRSRKRDSYVLTRVFDSGLLKESEKKEVEPYHDSLANFCLVRRYDYNSLSTDDLEKRLNQLAPYLLLNMMQFNRPIDYLEARNNQLRDFVKSEWLSRYDLKKYQDVCSLM